MNNQIQLVLKSSTTELSLNDRELGIYLTPELDGLTGLPEIRTTSGVNAGYDGGWTSAQNYDARSITIRGVIANEDVATVEQLRRQLTTLAGQGKNEELTLDLVTQAGKAYTIQVRTIALEMSLQKVLTQQEFMLQLRADDPLIYDASETGHEALLQVAQATGGFTIDFELPLAITGSSEETVVNNEGLEQVPTVTRMYGELHNPKIINQTTNQFMQIEADLGYAEGDWIEPSEVVSGKDITINDAPEGAPFSQFDLKGNTEQTTYTGKNLLKPYAKTATASDVGLDATLNYDGSITISGTASADTWLEFGFKFGFGTQRQSTALYSLDSSSTYTLSTTRTGTQTGNCWLYIQSSSSGTEKVAAIGNSASFSGADGVYRSWLRIASGASFTNVTIYPQLEKSSSATAWEKYVGGTASPNPDYPQAVQTVTGEQTVEIEGKNKIKSSTTGSINWQGTEITYAGDQITINKTSNGGISANAHTNTVYTPLNANQAYTFSMSYKSGTINLGYTDYWRFYLYAVSADGTISITNRWTLNIPRTTTTPSASATFTPSEDLVGYRLGCYIPGPSPTTTGDVVFNVQLELGSTATSFAPYNATSYSINLGSIELCKIGTYQDYIYKDGGKWYVRKEVGKLVQNGTETGWYNLSGSTSYARTNAATSFVKNVSFFANRGLTTPTSGTRIKIPNNNLYWYETGYESIEAFKSSLATTNLIVYAPLLTPTDTEITNEALVGQLEALAAATMYNPQTNITTLYAEGNEQPTLDVSYFTDKNPDTRDELVIDSRLRTITLNGLDVYHLQAPGSEFLMLAPGENRLSLQSDITGDNGYAQVSYKQGYLSI